jgi:hypothetical protein
MGFEEIRLDDESGTWFAVIALECYHYQFAPLHRQPVVSATSANQSGVSFSFTSSDKSIDCRRASFAKPGLLVSGTQICSSRSPAARSS